MYLNFAENKHGTDYCVGDIHGTFDRLKVFLDKLGFNYEHDRLFSVGDLVNRGPNSDQVMGWLEGTGTSSPLLLTKNLKEKTTPLCYYEIHT